MKSVNLFGLHILFVLLTMESQPAYSQIFQRRERTAHALVGDVYHGCGFDKYCLKICHPLQSHCLTCIAEYNCPAMVTVELREDKYFSQLLIQRLGVSDEYIGIGLSSDARMGDDAVVICLVLANEGNPRTLQHLNGFGVWTTGLRTINYNISLESHPFYDLTHEVINGTYVCSFQWKKTFTMNGRQFNLETDEYNLLASKGEAAGLWTINGHHRSDVARVVSQFKTMLHAVPEVDDYDERFEDGSSGLVANTFISICSVLAACFVKSLF